MEKLFSYTGNVLAITGMTLGLAAGVGRLSGSFMMFGFQSLSLFVVGAALIITGCFFKLLQLASLLENR